MKKELEHGTIWKYQRDGCRCDRCGDAKRRDNRQSNHFMKFKQVVFKCPKCLEPFNSDVAYRAHWKATHSNQSRNSK